MNNLHGETTIEGLQKWVKNYSDYNVGVVSKRGVGRLMFFDDDSGIAARIEQETGEKIPATYRVQTRPDTNPLKQHFYFKQTEYSFKKFATFADGGNPWNSKNVNRKDLTKFTLSRSGLQIHPTLYDLKCIGGVNLVVAAGSLRAPDSEGRIEKYTCVDESDPIDIPNGLVDWFVKDIKRYLVAVQNEKAKKFTEKSARIANLKTYDVIAEEDIFDFLRWRAHTLAGHGLLGEVLEQALTYIARIDCENGEVFVASEHGKAMIHKVASADWERGNATWFYKTGEPKSEVVGGHIMIYRNTTKHGVMESIIKEFPDKIATTDAFDRLEKGLAEEDYTFDATADRGMVYAARKATGFAVQGHRWWVRVTEVPEQPAMPLVKPEVSA